MLQHKEKENIHPDDWEKLEKYPHLLCIHQCIGIEEEFIIIQFGDCQLRIKSSLFHISSEPTFKPLEQVKCYNSKGFIEFGIIKGIYWHNKEQKYYYDVEVNGRIKSRRYFDHDLSKV